jgi:hypothetical protein
MCLCHQLKTAKILTDMAQAIPEIAIIRSLEGSLRDCTLSPAIITSIQQVHECLSQRTDTQGWRHTNRHVDGNSGRNGGGSGGNHGNHGYRGGSDRGGDRRGDGVANVQHSNSREHVRGGFVPRSDNPFGNRRGGGEEQRRPGGGGNSRGYNYGGGGSGSGGGNNGYSRNERNIPASSGPASPTTPATAAASTAPQQYKPPQKYVSRFTNGTSKSVDDKILNTIILGKLNKFSKANYDEIKEFMCQILDSGQNNFLKHFMILVFEKAASEEIYCGLYATLISELSSKYTFLLGEMSELYMEYMEIFKEVNEASVENYEELIDHNDKKKYRLGYSQFLAELIKHGVINSEIFNKTIDIVVEQIIQNMSKDNSSKITEELIDCLVRISKAIKSDTSDNSSTIKEHMKAVTVYQIEPYTIKNPDVKSLTNKARFACMDISKIINGF